MAIITIKDNEHDIIFIFFHFQCLSMHTCTHAHTHTGAVQQEMFDHTHVCIYVHTSTHTRYQGTADSAVHKSTGTVSAFLGHRQCSVPKGTHTYTHTYGHTFTHGRTHTHTKAGIPLAQLNRRYAKLRPPPTIIEVAGVNGERRCDLVWRTSRNQDSGAAFRHLRRQ